MLSKAGIYEDTDIPSSSPPSSSPLTSRYFLSSSPIRTASSPCRYNTPPTSPVKISKAEADHANTSNDKFKEVQVQDVEKTGIVLDQSHGSEEVGVHFF